MSRPPVLRAREVVQALLRLGFVIQHQTGSHVRLRREGNPTRTVTVPYHTGDVPLGTLRRILEQAGITAEDLKSGRRIVR